MELVQVDVLGIQTLQTGLTRPADVCRVGIVARHLAGVLFERVPELRSNDDVVAVAGEGPAQYPFAMPATVDIRGVEEGDANKIKRAMERRSD
jgi:hypothetical protein